MIEGMKRGPSLDAVIQCWRMSYHPPPTSTAAEADRFLSWTQGGGNPP